MLFSGFLGYPGHPGVRGGGRFTRGVCVVLVGGRLVAEAPDPGDARWRLRVTPVAPKVTGART